MTQETSPQDVQTITGVLPDDFGLITRTEKGSPLTWQELDDHASTLLDAIVFNEKSYNSVLEYGSLRAAPVLASSGQSASVEPVNGFGAIRLDVNNIIGEKVTVDIVTTGWVYSNGIDDARDVDFSTYTIEPYDTFIVFELPDTTNIQIGSGSDSGDNEG